VKGGGVWGYGPQTDKQLPPSPFTGQFFYMRTFCIAFFDYNLSKPEMKDDSESRHYKLKVASELLKGTEG
jgi:hypothetical protein